MIANPKNLYESCYALASRNIMYPGLLELMPVDMPGKKILDYGCGPGHDTIMFLQNDALKVWATDISEVALSVLANRLHLHGLALKGNYTIATSPMAYWPAVDHVHCAGVLHHLEDPVQALKDFHQTRCDTVRVMVYDSASAYVKKLGGLEQFKKAADGGAPIVNAWTQQEFYEMCEESGWIMNWVGSYRALTVEPRRGKALSACYELTPAEGWR